MPTSTPTAPKTPSTPPSPKTRKDRSPNYPAHTIKEALAKAELIWANEKKHAVSPAVAVQHMGLKSATSGSAAPLLSSLRKYGLIDSLDNGDIRISEEASKVFLYGPAERAHVDALKKLAMRPRIFQAVLAKFNDGLPSDANLRSRLQDEWKFASADAADAFIRTLRVALEVAGVDGPPSPAENGGEDDASEDSTMTPTQAITTQGPKTPPTLPLPTTSGHAFGWDLGGGVRADVRFSGDLGPEQVESLKMYVAILERTAGMKKAGGQST